MYGTERTSGSDYGVITGKRKSILKNETLIKIFGISLVILLVSFVISLLRYISIYNQSNDINTLVKNGELKEGEYVSVGVYAAYDYYSRLVEYFDDINSGEFTKKKYYPIVLDDGSIISISVAGNEDMRKMSEIYQTTLDWMYDETGTKYLHTPVIFEGKLVEIEPNTNLRRYYDEFIKSLMETYDESEQRPNVYYFDIDTSSDKSDNLWVVIGLGVFSVLTGIALINTIKLKNSEKKNKLNYDNKIERLSKNRYLLYLGDQNKDDIDDDRDETDNGEEINNDVEKIQEKAKEEQEDNMEEKFTYARFKYTEKYNSNNNERDNTFF